MKISKISKEELSFFANQLSFISLSGIHITWGLLNIKKHSSRRFAKIIGNIIFKIESGMKFHESLEGFPDFFVHMVKAGEEASNFQEIFTNLASHYEKEALREKEIMSLLIYPIFIVLALVLVIVITIMFLIPTFIVFFEEQGADLPFMTEFLINAAEFLSSPIFLVIFILSFIAFIVFKNLNLFDIIIFKFFRKQLEITYSKILANSLQIMLNSGVGILEALEISKNMHKNNLYKQKISYMYTEIEKGVSIASAALNADIFHYTLIGMMTVGETSGSLAESLSKCALFLEKEERQNIERTKKIIEPVLTIVIGIILFFIMLSLMLPAFTLMEVI